MRYDKRVYFVKETKSTRNPDGTWTKPTLIKEPRWANVSDQGTERMNLLYGGLRQGALTVRIQNGYNQPFDYMEVDGRRYNVDHRKTFRRDAAFEVSERQ